MNFGNLIQGFQKVDPKLYDALMSLNSRVENFFANFFADATGIKFGDIKFNRSGLVESHHGLYIRGTLEAADPIYAIYQQGGGNLAGAGLFNWDTIIFQKTGWFARQAANAEILCTQSGAYLVTFNGLSYGNGAGVQVNATLEVNGVAVAIQQTAADGVGTATFSLNTIVSLTAGQNVRINCSSNRYGADGRYSRISIHKLN